MIVSHGLKCVTDVSLSIQPALFIQKLIPLMGDMNRLYTVSNTVKDCQTVRCLVTKPSGYLSSAYN